MMQESGTEATSNGPASQNGAASVEGGARDTRPKSATSVDVTAADLIHLQQQQEQSQIRPDAANHINKQAVIVMM
ncbi:hypothetical protein J4Q44_G00101570 [Coregonus suidteri]|uniref:Uncharacterized protein n=1 Tax=Coregonus suidteri TaxID=861788 RepID=A0AAN8MPZ1_9TELE